MGVYTRPDSPWYWLHLERPGHPRVRLKTAIRVQAATPAQTRENRRLAEVEYHTRMTELARNRLDLPGQTAMTLAAFLKQHYRPWLEREKPDSCYWTLYRLDTVLAMLHGLPLTALTPAAIEGWKRTRTTVSPQTITKDINALRGALKKAIEWGILSESPLAGLHVSKAPGREIVRYLAPDEAKRLVAALEARDAAGREARERTIRHRQARGKPPLPPLPHYADHLTPMVLVSLHTGLRRGELLKLTWRAIDWHAKTLTIEWHTAKTRRLRRIPLNATALDVLRKWKEQSDGPQVFALTSAKKAFAAVLTAAGIEDFRWHDLRHTFASWLVQRGRPLAEVRDLLGHSSIAQTERYSHLAPHQGRAAVETLDSGHAPVTDDRN